ncbi:uncharacterized protein LOC112463259 [Temnothorax curvispinosus]|uniref:Uncharacterized protein LOC112463259 n=1 Tax=Temnothorax curvispinosus TaxID=300111 RepID=A0A6J1QS82_9HYME|nr:uncharacterized protein LOC112463259 [Temnothorax curvispinosus]
MEQDRNKLLLQAAVLVLREIIDILFESDDDELEILEGIINPKRCVPRRRVPRIENYVEKIIGALTKQEFKAHFRMYLETCDYVLSYIEPRLQRTKSGTPMISPRTQFLLALWRLGTPDSFRSICERFNVGRSTALYITRRVVRALVELAPVIIKWPADERLNEPQNTIPKLTLIEKAIIQSNFRLSVITSAGLFIVLLDTLDLSMINEYSVSPKCTVTWEMLQNFRKIAI